MRCCKSCGCYLPDNVYICLACGFDERNIAKPVTRPQPAQPPVIHDYRVVQRDNGDLDVVDDVVILPRDVPVNSIRRAVLTYEDTPSKKERKRYNQKIPRITVMHSCYGSGTDAGLFYCDSVRDSNGMIQRPSPWGNTKTR